MNILNTLRKNNTVKSCIYKEIPVEFISTGCYTLNILFSGQLFGGIQIGRMSSVVSPPSLGKCSRGTEEIDIIISDEVFEKYFKNKVNYKILEKKLRIEFADLFSALNLNTEITSETIYNPVVDIFVETPYGETKINHLIKKPSQKWINIKFDGIDKPCQVSPNHLFFTNKGLCFAKESLNENVIFKHGQTKRVIDITDGINEEPLYDISINNTNAPDGYQEAYYLANGSLNHNTFIGLKVAKNAQQQHGMEVLYIDTEIAYDPSFAKNIGVDLEQMLVVQNNQIEDVIQIVSSTIKDLSKDERNKLLIVIDSWGGLVTSKTIGDAIDGKDVTDMTIAKKKNSLARILNGLGSTCFVVNQTYECHSDIIKVKTPESPVLIKSIKTGDLVLTTDGFQAVTHTISYPNVPIYRLRLEDGTTLESTEEHKYLRNGKWVKVSDLSCGDDIDRI